MTISIFYLIIGFLLLIAGAHLLVDGASSLAKRLNVSNLVIGLTVVAFGTSMPEFFVNLNASITNNTQIALGNIIGSNIFNILIILGISCLIYPLKITKNTVWKEIPFSLLAAILVLLLANDRLIDKSSGSSLTRIDGLILLSFFVIFIYYLHNMIKKDKGGRNYKIVSKYSMNVSLIFIGLGLLLLISGGKTVVNSAVELALALGVSQSFIGLTIVACGTSLPELATSVTATLKKNTDIGIGNVVGSNIFNIFFILGTSAVIRPISLAAGNNLDSFVLIIASVFLFVFMFSGKKHRLDRWEGVLFVILYSGYILFLIRRG